MDTGFIEEMLTNIYLACEHSLQTVRDNIITTFNDWNKRSRAV